MVTIASAHEYITEQEKQGKTDREIFDGILELDGDVWHVVELVRDLGWSIDRFEAAQIGDELGDRRLRPRQDHRCPHPHPTAP